MTQEGRIPARWVFEAFQQADPAMVAAAIWRILVPGVLIIIVGVSLVTWWAISKEKQKMSEQHNYIVRPYDALVIEPGTSFTVTIPAPDPTPTERRLRAALESAQDEIRALREQIARRGFYRRPGAIRVGGGPAQPTAGAPYRILKVMDVTGDHEFVEVRVALP